MRRLCQQCHARVSESVDGERCPACGGLLVVDPGASLDAPPQLVDHRGILLPRRHAVGGVITPR